MFKTGELAKLLGVEKSFLHYYDEIGIIVPNKNEKNYRLYNENDLIALASSKYYRAMHMNLKDLSEVILRSNQLEKVNIMEKQKELLLFEAERFKDMAQVAEFAINTYKYAYQEDIIVESDLEAFYFIPLIHKEQYQNDFLEQESVKKLLDFFPFVSYAYYFPKDSILHEEKFDYHLGLSVIAQYQKKYKISLPEGATSNSTNHCIIMPLTKNIENDSFTFANFQSARDYAQANHLELTGEAIAYCVFTNYEKENANIKFVVQLITK